MVRPPMTDPAEPAEAATDATEPATAADGLPPLRAVIAAHSLAARKSLGQNFLLDLNLTRRIAREAGPLDDALVVEIGPGPGGLTRALLVEGAARVHAIERDGRCLGVLDQIAAAYPGRLTWTEGDAMDVDYAALASTHAGPVKIVSNLPYNIGTSLAVGWLTAPWPPYWSSLTLMFQREVADRLVARPGTKAYGRLSVLAQWRGRARVLFNVPPRAFTPPPKVSSSVVHLEPTAPLDPAVEPAALERVVAAAFGQRRKMLRAALKPLGVDTAALLAQAGLAETDRAERVDVAGFCRLARAYQALR